MRAGRLCARVLGERRTDKDAVAQLALARSSKSRGRAARSTGLTAGEFVAPAARLLEAGQHNEAAQLFAALLELRPGDGEAHNN